MAYTFYDMGNGQCHMPKGAQRLDSKHACTYNVFIDFAWWQCIQSYDTPIALYRVNGDIPFIVVNRQSFDCSNTTIRHFSKWMNSLNVLYGGYSTIKKAVNGMAEGELGQVAINGYDVCVMAVDDAWMRKYVK